MSIAYKWEMSGTAAEGQTWIAKGATIIEKDKFPTIHDLILKDAFYQIMHGEAVYGRPGVGCKGPYEIDRYVVEKLFAEVKQ